MTMIKQTINSILFSLATWAIIWAFFSGGLLYFRYFTNQSVVLVWLTSVLFFTKIKNTNFFSYLSTISLISIFITMTGFHILLDIPKLTLHFQLTHTIIPLTYILYYYFVIKSTIPLKKFWITLIHPIMYALIFLLYGEITSWYPYPFLDVSMLGLSNVLIFVFIILLPIYLLLSLLLIYIKKKYLNFIKKC